MTNIDNFFTTLRPMLTLVEEVLDEAFADVNTKTFQVPVLLRTLGVRLDWTTDTIRQNDPVVRAYLRDHPVWYITRGAKGGIMPRAEHDRKEALKVAKETAKEELKAAVKLRLEQAAAPVIAE
jgi:hypothetical protein